MDKVTVDKIVDHSMYTKTDNVKGYRLPDATSAVVNTFDNQTLIGNVYSWVVGSDGNVYWMFYITDADFNNQQSTYIQHNGDQLTVPDLPEILAAITLQQQQDAIAKKGVVGYYLDKYLPYIIGAVVLVIALPTITNEIQKRK